MNLRERVQEVIENGDVSQIEALVAANSGAVRYFIGLSYRPDAGSRELAAKAMAAAARHHPDLSQEMIRRLIWAMNDESGTNAVTATEVIQAVADENPEILIPLLADLIRLSFDESLADGLLAAVNTVCGRCSGKIGKEIDGALKERLTLGRRP